MFFKAVSVLVLAVVFVPILLSVWDMDWALHFHKHHPGKCRAIKRLGTGSEDFQILSSGLTFISSGFLQNGCTSAFKTYMKSMGRGSIQMVDMSLPVTEAKVLNIKHGKDFNPDTFRPHGLSVLEDKVKNEHLLYVINHAEGQDDSVEKFRFSPKTNELHHEKSFFGDLLLQTNDLTAVSEDKFYITNWLYFNTEIMNILETLYHPPICTLLFYNGTGFSVVIGGLVSPNSVVLSKDKRFLYVSMPHLKAVHVYKRESDLNLELVQEASVDTILDNLHWSQDGNSLYGGCHPIKHNIAKYLVDPTSGKTPSLVIHLPLKDGLIVENEITNQFYDHGDLIAGSTVAGVFKNKLLIGSIADTLVTCDLPDKP